MTTDNHQTNAMAKAVAGHFYAVGVGPGAPDLLTLRAVNLIQSADIIITPRSAQTEVSMARQIIEPYLQNQEIIEQAYPMERNLDKTLRAWGQVAEMIAERSQRGQSIVQTTLGDPLLYSTSCYLLDQLLPRFPEGWIHVVPGISAMQTVAALSGDSLALQEDRLMLMTAHDLNEVEKAFTCCETLVLYKCGKKLGELAALLERQGLANQTFLACYAEQEGKQFITQDLRAAADGKPGYLATAIIHVGRRGWKTTNLDKNPEPKL